MAFSEWHREFEGTVVLLGLQVGRSHIGAYSSLELIPGVEVGWNWRIYIGLSFRWLFWYVGVYVIKPAYRGAILKRRERYRDKPEDLKWCTAISDRPKGYRLSIPPPE